MRFLSALLAPRAKPAADRPTGTAQGPEERPAPVEWQDTRSYLDSVLTQIAAANEALAKGRRGAAFADTEPAAMDPEPAVAARRARLDDRLDGLEVVEVEDADLLMRLFDKTHASEGR